MRQERSVFSKLLVKSGIPGLPIPDLVTRSLPTVAVRQSAHQVLLAPGQLASHYAPKTPLILLEEPENIRPEESKRYVLFSYTGANGDPYVTLHDWECIEALSPGSGKLAEAAIRLFFVMRTLDEAGLDAIIAEPVSETGLGDAIMDHLRRAAS